jgi:hypothetical protein
MIFGGLKLNGNVDLVALSDDIRTDIREKVSGDGRTTRPLVDNARFVYGTPEKTNRATPSQMELIYRLSVALRDRNTDSETSPLSRFGYYDAPLAIEKSSSPCTQRLIHAASIAGQSCLGPNRSLGFRCEGSGFVDTFHRLQQPLGLFGVWDQPQLKREFHYSGVYHSYHERTARLLSWLKPEVSGAEVVL